jgi:hypothetical protein
LTPSSGELPVAPDRSRLQTLINFFLLRKTERFNFCFRLPRGDAGGIFLFVFADWLWLSLVVAVRSLRASSFFSGPAQTKHRHLCTWYQSCYDGSAHTPFCDTSLRNNIVNRCLFFSNIHNDNAYYLMYLIWTTVWATTLQCMKT